jgi:hypothetical protein
MQSITYWWSIFQFFSSVWGSIQLLPCNICSLGRDVTGDLQARRDVEHRILMINIPILSFSLSFNQALCLQQLFPGWRCNWGLAGWEEGCGASHVDDHICNADDGMVQVYIPEVRNLHPTSFSNPILHDLNWKFPKKRNNEPNLWDPWNCFIFDPRMLQNSKGHWTTLVIDST